MNFLDDLNLAGVKWELEETAFGVTQQNEEIGAIAHSAKARVATAVVPPISPVVHITADTARAVASRPGTLEILLRVISEFNHPLRGGVSNVVLPHVAPSPNGVLVLTDIPSSDDDASGRILTGAAGELLDKMMGAIGMSRENVSLCPLLFWRTPGGRSPTQGELDLSRPFVDRFIELTEPRIILGLGTLVAKEFANIDLIKNHGEVTDYKENAKFVPIFHPNYLILKPGAKQPVWTVLQNVQNMLKNL